MAASKDGSIKLTADDERVIVQALAMYVASAKRAANTEKDDAVATLRKQQEANGVRIQALVASGALL